MTDLLPHGCVLAGATGARHDTARLGGLDVNSAPDAAELRLPPGVPPIVTPAPGEPVTVHRADECSRLDRTHGAAVLSSDLIDHCCEACA